jgi:ADP-heptose:LPS heptosyltransferase
MLLSGGTVKRLLQYVYKSRVRSACVFAFDLLGFLCFFPFRFFRKRLDPDRLQKILIIRLDNLGDVVMVRPALQALWRKFPGAQIDLALSAENVVLFDDAKEVRNILPVTGHWFSPTSDFYQKWKTFFKVLWQIRKVRYDLAIDFRGDLRHILLMWLAGIPRRFGYGITGGGFMLTHEGRYAYDKHQVDLNMALLEPLGVHEIPKSEPFTYSGERKRRFWNLYGDDLKQAGNLPRIVLHAGASYPSKRWFPERYEELVTRILEANLGQVVLMGTELEKTLWPGPKISGGKLVDLRGKTRISDLPILFDASQLFVGNDSGPAHIAAAQGLSTVVLFSGTNDYRLWHPWTARLYLIRHEVECSPCEERFCVLGHHDCMEKVTAADVFEKVKSILSSLPESSSEGASGTSEI